MRRFRPTGLLLALLLLLAACRGPQPTPTVGPPTPGATLAAATATAVPVVVAGQTPTAIAIITPTGTVLITATPNSGAEGATGWSSAGSLASGRAAHTASLLPNGRVLVVGGETNASSGQNALARAEVYDLSANRWVDAGSLGLGRRNHTATVLPNGNVLVVGGELGRAGTATAATTPAVELYDAASNSWRALAPAASSRSGHTASLLPDGRVLVVGGLSVAADGAPAQSVAVAEIYDPVTNSWSQAGSLSLGRSGHTATVLPDGRVLIVGGESRGAAGATDLTASSELYDPATNSWSPTGPLTTGRQGHTATLLANGQVLVVGGQTSLSRGGQVTFIAAGLAAAAPSSTAELFDPATKSWKPVASLASERSEHTTTLLPSGQLLVIGGVGKDGVTPLATAERYDPATDRWATVAAPTARAGHTATLLPDGSVLVVGGKGSGNTYLASAELYVSRTAPSAAPTATATPTPAPSVPPVAPTGTPTPAPTQVPTATSTPPRPTATVAPAAPTATPTATLAPPTSTATATNTPVPPTATPTRTNTPVPPTNTPTRTPTRTNTPVPQPGTVFGTVQYCGSACFAAPGVAVSGGGKQTTTNASGGYTLAGVGPGTITVTISVSNATGTYTDSKSVNVPAGGRVQLDFTIP